MVTWTSPFRNFYKLNTDGSSLKNPGKGDIGVVIRNSNGDWVLIVSQSFMQAFNNFVELMTLRQDLKLALEHNLCPIIINIDSEDVIGMLTKGNSLFNPIIQTYRLLIRRLGGPLIHHIYKEQKRIADT